MCQSCGHILYGGSVICVICGRLQDDEECPKNV